MSKVIFLVGASGTGKTAYAKNYLEEHPNVCHLSRDDYINKYSKLFDLTYNESFKLYHQNIEREMDIVFEYLVSQEKNIIIDMTNLTIKSRFRWLSKISLGYQKIAIMFLNKHATQKIDKETRIELEKIFETPTDDEFDTIRKT